MIMTSIISRDLLRRMMMCKHCIHQPKAYMYNKYDGVSRDWMAWIQQDIDFRPATLQRWYERSKWKSHKDDHSYSPESINKLGSELAAAHFIVARGGAVKFVGSNQWIEGKKDGSYSLPGDKTPGYNIEAIDASGMYLIYESFTNLTDLKHLKYLNLSKCAYIDDWCMDVLIEYRDTLLVLDISGSPNLTENGIAALHKLKKLRRLVCHDMEGVKQPALLKLMLEEVLPSCVIEGLMDYSAATTLENAEPIPEPVLVLPPPKIIEIFKKQGDYNPHLHSKGTIENDLRYYKYKKK